MNDAERILNLFRNSGGRMISCSELVEGQYYGTKKIIEYTGRIGNAREKMGCTCGKDKNRCTAQEHIVNVKTNWYQYQSKHKQERVDVPDISTQKENLVSVTYKLQRLREEYRNATNDTDKRLIELRAKALKNTLTTHNYQTVESMSTDEVQEALI